MPSTLLYRPLFRRTATALALGTTAWALDKYAYDSTLKRNIRTLYNGLLITLDYKLNFVPGNASDIEALHERVAKRILDVCKKNGGLYIKFGQQIASVPVLPPGYHSTFRVLFDDAPGVPYSVVEKIFAQEFNGKKPHDVFETFTRIPVASASIAQVHRATLKNGQVVAVKIQKPEIAKQIGWDLFTYKILCQAMEWIFELPLTWSANYIEQHIRQETDFINEARNSERAAQYLTEAPRSLKDKVYIPKIIWDWTSPRVMTAEWIDGVKFTDTESISKNSWSKKEIMTTIVTLFADQIFRTGFVHSDPHPGNILIRPHPSHPSKPQITLLDHGLYVQCSPTFTKTYALFWKSLFLADLSTLNTITSSWGINDTQLFASATLQKPWTPGKPLHVDTSVNVNELFEAQMRMKESVKHFLSDTEKTPKELVFVGRNINLIRANNKSLGSPVNRINIMANTAVRSLGNDWSLWSSSSTSTSHSTITYFITSRLNYYTFRTTLLITSLFFHISRVIQKLRFILFRRNGGGFEEVLDSGMKKAIEERFGVVIDERVFEG